MESGCKFEMQVLVTAFTVVPSRSGAVRTFEQRAVLEQFNPRCVAVSLSGYIFFGSSVAISDKVMEVWQNQVLSKYYKCAVPGYGDVYAHCLF